MKNESGSENASQTKSPDKKQATRKVDGTFAKGWKPEEPGEVLSGTYLGAQEALGKKGTFRAYHIRDNEGVRWSVSGASLNSIFPQIPKKTKVTITYQGTVEQGKGDMKVFDVEIPSDVQLIDPFEDEE